MPPHTRRSWNGVAFQSWVTVRMPAPGDDHRKNNLPDILMRWEDRGESERARLRTAQSFCVPKAEVRASGYDLSMNLYKEIQHENREHDSPAKIIAELRGLEAEIAGGLRKLEEMGV
jgi:type I restriction enzyme M protein